MGWKTEQGPTPNSRVKKLKNKLGRLSPAWLGGASSAGGTPPQGRGDWRSTRGSGQTSRHMARDRGDRARDVGGALGLQSRAAV